MHIVVSQGCLTSHHEHGWLPTAEMDLTLGRLVPWGRTCPFLFQLLVASLGLGSTWHRSLALFVLLSLLHIGLLFVWSLPPLKSFCLSLSHVGSRGPNQSPFLRRCGLFFFGFFQIPGGFCLETPTYFIIENSTFQSGSALGLRWTLILITAFCFVVLGIERRASNLLTKY